MIYLYSEEIDFFFSASLFATNSFSVLTKGREYGFHRHFSIPPEMSRFLSHLFAAKYRSIPFESLSKEKPYCRY